MNKNMLKICFVIALTACAASAYGASTISSPLVLGGGTYSPSNKVTLSVDSTANNYTAKSKHGAGDRIIVTNNTDPRLWYKTVNITASNEVSATSEVLSSSSWTSM
jgi:hypothetical protein